MKRLLIVDDNEAYLRALVRLLRPWRVLLEVETAEDVESGRRAVRNAAPTRPFDLVLSDLDMPDGTGFDLAEGIHQDLKVSRYILFMSGLVTDERTAIAKNWGELIDKGPDVVPRVVALLELMGDRPMLEPPVKRGGFEDGVDLDVVEFWTGAAKTGGDH